MSCVKWIGQAERHTTGFSWIVIEWPTDMLCLYVAASEESLQREWYSNEWKEILYKN